MIKPSELRRFAGCFPTGVAVVTSCDASGCHSGLTMNAVTSLSLDPPLYLICVDRRSTTLKAILESNVFGVTLLSETQEPLARQFASKQKEKFKCLDYIVGETGVPLLSDAIGWIECRLIDSFPGGDHLILIGEVLSSVVRGGRPLLFVQGNLSSVPVFQAQDEPNMVAIEASLEGPIPAARECTELWSDPVVLERAVENVGEGKCVVLAGAEEWNFEGCLVTSGRKIDAERVNFMATYAGGIICVALNQERVDELNIPMQVRRGASSHMPLYLASVDAKEGISTGISAEDRARTIVTLSDPTKGPEDIVCPGHIFPAVARSESGQSSCGYVERSLELVELGGSGNAAAFSKILGSNGMPARGHELFEFASSNHLECIAIPRHSADFLE